MNLLFFRRTIDTEFFSVINYFGESERDFTNKHDSHFQ